MSEWKSGIGTAKVKVNKCFFFFEQKYFNYKWFSSAVNCGKLMIKERRDRETSQCLELNA